MKTKRDLIAKILGIFLIVLGAIYTPIQILAVMTDFPDEVTYMSYLINPGFVAIILGIGFFHLGNFLKDSKRKVS